MTDLELGFRSLWLERDELIAENLRLRLALQRALLRLCDAGAEAERCREALK